MKLLIAGSRDFSDYKLLKDKVNEMRTRFKITEIVSGTARGADRLGERYAENNNLSLSRFPADWNKYGKRAGYLRNAVMADYCDIAIIFWNRESRGTKHMIDLMEKTQKPFKVFIIN